MKITTCLLLLLTGILSWVSGSVEAGGNHQFKVRIGVNGKLSDAAIVGNKPETSTATFPITVQRFRGQDPLRLLVAYDIIEGAAEYWYVKSGSNQVSLGASPDSAELSLSVTAKPNVPAGSQVCIRIRCRDAMTGEVHDAYAHVISKPYGFSLDVLNRPDLTNEKTQKLVFDRNVYFDLGVISKSADADIVSLTVTPVSGFSAQTVDASFNPLNMFALSSQTSDPSGWPPSGRRFRLNLQTPAGWPRGSQQKITIRANSKFSSETASLDLTVTKASGLWNASDLFNPQGGRRHLVRPGKTTTFELLVTNILPQPAVFYLIPTRVAPSPDWQLGLSDYKVSLGAGEKKIVSVTLTAPANAIAGSVADWNITMLDFNGFININRVGAEVTSLRKIIYVAVDGLQPEYLSLNAKGTGPGSPGDWLTPHIRSFMGISTNYTNAQGSLPSTTDANHVNALSGTRSGTAGISSVFYTYFGKDHDGAAVSLQGDSSLLRYGPEGAPVLTAFDVAKKVNPNAYTAIVSGKNWVTSYFQKKNGVDIVANGHTMPYYINDPEQYVLGDPPTDDDPADPGAKADFADWGAHPGMFPDDRWVMNSAMRIIENEDPDVLYMLLSATDDIQHQAGAAWDPAEWDDKGTDALGDDTNTVNPLAVRNDIIDVVREMDYLFGDLIAYLSKRGTIDDTYIVLLSDHGSTSKKMETIDLRPIIENAGFAYKEDFEAFAGCDLMVVYGVAPEDQQMFEEVLENAPLMLPGGEPNPWIVINRSEMKSGVDQKTGTRIAAPNELYSEFYVEHEKPGNEQQQWPSFYIFFTGSWQSAPLFMQTGEYAEWGRLFTGGHGGLADRKITLALHGPGVPKNAVITEGVSIADIAPTLYRLQGWPMPDSVEGIVLPGILDAGASNSR